LTNGKILIVGTLGKPVLYDPPTDMWTELPSTNNAQGRVSLVQWPISQRIFLFGGSGTSTVAQEFNQVLISSILYEQFLYKSIGTVFLNLQLFNKMLLVI